MNAGWPDLRDALRAEWTKLRTVRSTGWLLACSAGLTIAVSALTASIVRCPASCGADTTKVGLTGIMLGQATVAVLSVLVMSGEYSTGMIGLTMLAMPRRSFLLAAKAIVLACVVLAAGAFAVLGSLLASRWLLAANGYTPTRGFVLLSLYHGPTLRAAAGSVLYLGLISLLSLGIAAAARDSGVAITVTLGLIYVVPVLGGLILDPHWERRFERYAPASAGLAIQATRDLAALPIGPWEGLGVLAAWSGLALLAGWILLRLRDA